MNIKVNKEILRNVSLMILQIIGAYLTYQVDLLCAILVTVSYVPAVVTGALWVLSFGTFNFMAFLAVLLETNRFLGLVIITALIMATFHLFFGGTRGERPFSHM